MNKFLRPNKTKLKNAQHYSLMEAFKTVLTAAALAGVKLQALVTAWLACFDDENRCYMVARASEIIKRRDEADKRRDTLYTKLHQLVKVWLNSGNTTMEAAAEALIQIFRLYKVNTQAQIDEQTGQMDNLIIDISTTEMQAHLETLGAMWLFNQMVEAHEQVKAIRLEQGLEMSEKVVGALETARKASDAAYDNVLAMIEALSLTADDTAPYEAFIKQWNGTLKIYQDILDRKSGSESSSSSSQQGGTTEPSGEQGGTTENGENGGTEQGGSNNNEGNGTLVDDSEEGGDNGGQNNNGGNGTLIDDPELDDNNGGQNGGGSNNNGDGNGVLIDDGE